VFWAMAEDYPRTLLELEQRFSDEAKCRKYLFALRWSQGFVCPICGATSGLAIRRDLWRCLHCGRETSVLAGTIFQDSKLPLAVWFRAMWQSGFSKERHQCAGVEADDWFWQLQDRLGDAAQIAAGDGPTRTRSFERRGRSG